MEKQDLIDYLKEHLSIQLTAESEPYHGHARVKVVLTLDGQVISRDGAVIEFPRSS